MAELPSTTWQKYDTYVCDVDPKQGNRSTEIRFSTCAQPHMRAFYLAAWSFFVAFCSWFSFASLMPEVKKDLQLTADEVYVSNITAVSATIAARFIIGPLVDTYGARKAMMVLLTVGAIPTALSGFVRNATDLAVIRFFIGVLGATFVPCVSWTSAMFAKEVVGTANATAAGWGNLGGGVTQLVMVLLWQALRTGMSSETAWRVSFVIPACITAGTGIAVYFLGVDSPKGNYVDLIKHGSMVKKSSVKSSKLAYRELNSYIMLIQYGACFGIELAINLVAASYFKDKFNLSTATAGYIATSFGFMNIFSRSLGGYLCDRLHVSFGAGYTGMRGRLWGNFLCLFAEGICLIVFSRMNTLAGAAVMLVVFSLFVQMAEGASFSVVPYICPEATGAVSGMVGAGGNIGAMCWGFAFRFGPSNPSSVLLILGFIVTGLAFLTPLIVIRGHDSMFTKAKGMPATIDVI